MDLKVILNLVMGLDLQSTLKTVYIKRVFENQIKEKKLVIFVEKNLNLLGPIILQPILVNIETV